MVASESKLSEKQFLDAAFFLDLRAWVWASFVVCGRPEEKLVTKKWKIMAWLRARTTLKWSAPSSLDGSHLYSPKSPSLTSFIAFNVLKNENLFGHRKRSWKRANRIFGYLKIDEHFHIEIGLASILSEFAALRDCPSLFLARKYQTSDDYFLRFAKS